MVKNIDTAATLVLRRFYFGILGLGLLLWSGPAAQADKKPPKLQVEAQPVKESLKDVPKQGKVVDVLKGDELVLENGWVVRLLSVDVPTADFGKRSGHFYGKDALDLIKKLVLDQKVRLEYDVEPMDPYDRLLAYVYTDKDTLLNKLLIDKGLALAACHPPNTSRCDEFGEAQREALQARTGLWDFDPEHWPKAKPSETKLEGIVVRKAIDGDTIQLEDGTIVRYIGIDAPESEAVWKAGNFGHEAYTANRDLVEGKRVTLEYDVELSDPRGRELAYVYVERDGRKTMVNQKLVADGMAWVAVFPPNVRHIRVLYEAQKEAAGQERGIWKP